MTVYKTVIVQEALIKFKYSLKSIATVQLVYDFIYLATNEK